MDTESSREALPTLEEQFNNRERLQIGNETVEVVDIQPQTLKSEVPVFLVPGWAATPHTFKENILSLAEKGRRVIAVNSPHGIDAESHDEFSDVDMRKSEALLQVLKKKEIQQVDFVGHSQAGLDMSAAILRQPELCRNIILVNPAGMIGPDRFDKLTARFIHDQIRQNRRAMRSLFSSEREYAKRSGRILKTTSGPIAKNPARSFQEVQNMAQTQIEDRLREIKKMGKGVVIFHSVDDAAFPMERMQKIVRSEHVDGFFSTEGTHNEFILNPEGYTKLVDHALNALEENGKHKQEVE